MGHGWESNYIVKKLYGNQSNLDGISRLVVRLVVRLIVRIVVEIVVKIVVKIASPSYCQVLICFFGGEGGLPLLLYNYW